MKPLHKEATELLVGPDELDCLAAELPADLPSAAEEVHRAAKAAAVDVTVLAEQAGTWSVLAGRAPADAQVVPVHAIRVGRIALSPDATSSIEPATVAALRRAATWLALTLEREEARAGSAQAAEEQDAIRDVVGRLLSVRDADQVLLSIADHTLRLLDADICGVLLAEGDEVRMRSCVGHRVVETARLRMRRGQGLAGLVFLTGDPAKVDSYLDDRTISSDFMSLAEKEQTQSALAVPLRLQGEFIGVLEVWRRRPSVFTDQDVSRMVALADHATIAIDNARLHDKQKCALDQLQDARDALQQQVSVLARSAGLQQTLLSTVLEGVGLPAIARTVAVELDCQVGIYGPDGTVTAAHGGSRLQARVPLTLPTRNRPGRREVTLPGEAPTTAWIQPVYADGDQVGAVCLVPGPESEELMDVVAGQVAMACSLTLLRERAASRARTEELEQVLWDLLQGSVEHRIAARTRANQLNVTLRGSLRVLYGQIENIEELAAEYGWKTAQTDRVRRDVLRSLRALDEERGLCLSSLRGDLLVAVASNLSSSAVKDLVGGLSTSVRRQPPGLRLTWGVSRAHDDVVELPSALNEARTALAAAHRLGGDNVFLYEELGIVRLLLGSGSDPDLQTFINEITGPLIAYDKENDGSLTRTLRAFFDANCSQRLAAERLFVHHKTLRYRLEQIKQLTGLDLSRHDDRMRADFALRLLQVNRSALNDAAQPEAPV